MIHPELEQALREDRLFWRVSDQYGRSCNGGDRSFRLQPPSDDGQPGPWAARVENVSICSNGYHATSDPLRWAGCCVHLVEVDEVVQQENDKVVCHTFRSWGLVEPDRCVDVRVCVAASRPYLDGANLRGANLGGANLDGADLRGANLYGAYLRGAYLLGANLAGADLGGANLLGADLRGAYLYGAYLRGAYLLGANLAGADLGGANLLGANLEGADLDGANLLGANLAGANLPPNWESVVASK